MPAVQLAFSTNAFTSFSLEDALRSIAAVGYRAVEILADGPHAFAMDLTDTYIEKTRDLMMLLGLTVSNVNANTASGYHPDPPAEKVYEPSLCNPDPKQRLWRVDYTRKAIDLAARMSCPNVSITSGHALPGCPPEDARKLLLESLGQVLEHAAMKGVRVGIDYEPGLLIDNTPELLRLIEDCGSPQLGANFGVGHAWLAGDDVHQSLTLLGDRLFNVHVEDIKGNEHYHLIPGKGDIPIESFMENLKKLPWSGYVTVDLNSCAKGPVAAAGKAISVLRKML